MVIAEPTEWSYRRRKQRAPHVDVKRASACAFEVKSARPACALQRLGDQLSRTVLRTTRVQIPLSGPGRARDPLRDLVVGRVRRISIGVGAESTERR